MSRTTVNYSLWLTGIFSALAICFCGTMTVSQGQKIDRKRPSVFISFDSFVKKKAAPGHPSEAARLILHNNTRWPIYYEKNYDPMVGAGSIIHVIEFVDGKRDVVSR